MRLGEATVFQDADSIEPGQPWRVAIAETIESASRIVVFWCRPLLLAVVVLSVGVLLLLPQAFWLFGAAVWLHELVGLRRDELYRQAEPNETQLITGALTRHLYATSTAIPVMWRDTATPGEDR